MTSTLKEKRFRVTPEAEIEIEARRKGLGFKTDADYFRALVEQDLQYAGSALPQTPKRGKYKRERQSPA